MRKILANRQAPSKRKKEMKYWEKKYSQRKMYWKTFRLTQRTRKTERERNKTHRSLMHKQTFMLSEKKENIKTRFVQKNRLAQTRTQSNTHAQAHPRMCAHTHLPTHMHARTFNQKEKQGERGFLFSFEINCSINISLIVRWRMKMSRKWREIFFIPFLVSFFFFSFLLF